MKSLNLGFIAEQMNAAIIQGDEELVIHNAVTKERFAKPGTLYFDVYRNAHKRLHIHGIPQCAVVTDLKLDIFPYSNNTAILRVDNIEKAYWKFVDFYRDLFDIPVIGVTGTCGKTTTKEMIKHILARRYKVAATYKSFNADFRHLGYLLDIDDSIQAGVFEMGVAASGDLKRCCRYFKPQVGVITNIGIDHLQAFDSLDSYIKAKGEFLDGLNNEGTLIINADNDYIKKIDLSGYKGSVIYYGFDEKSHFKVSDIAEKQNGISFNLKHEDSIYTVFVPGFAEYNAYNACAAIAAANAIGMDIQEAVLRLKTFENVEKHFEPFLGINGSIIIDDTWSTNPTSCKTALKQLKSIAKGRKTIAALGRMSLLGSESAKYHFKVGLSVAKLDIDSLIILGEDASEIGKGALSGGMSEEKIHLCRNYDEALEAFNTQLDNNTIVLVKTTMMASYAGLMNKLIVKKL